jgi:putative transposase
MLTNKAFQYKLKPTAEQERLFGQYCGAVRWVYNEMLAERKRTYKATGKSPSKYTQMARLTKLKALPETVWLSGIYSQVLQEAIKQLQAAYDRFFKGLSGYPKFKKRKNIGQSFSYPQGVKVEGSRVYLPKIGWVNYRDSRPVEGKIKRATVRHKASGWYVSLCCEVDMNPPVPKRSPDGIIGVDLGLNDFVVTSEGEHIPAPRFYRKAQRKLAKAQRALSRCKRGSKRRAKAVAKVARLHEKVANARADFLHKLSSRLVSENQGVIAEDLAIKGLGRTRLAKSVHDAGWGEFLRQLDYKTLWQGKVFWCIDRFFPSTKLHAACGTLNEVSLSDRVFVCQGCGGIVNRDENAARNIRDQGIIEIGFNSDVAAGQTETENAQGEPVRLATASAA